MSGCTHGGSCGRVVSSDYVTIPPELREPAHDLLCVSHFKEFNLARNARAARNAREASRKFCGCGREIYFRPEVRAQCAACDLGLPPPSAVDDGWMPTAVTGCISPDVSAVKQMTCYGNSGTCPGTGVLHPSGIWCDLHSQLRRLKSGSTRQAADAR